MNKVLTFAATTLLCAAASTSATAADVGVSVTIGEPGFYGTINIGDFPQPRLIYREPVLVEHVTVVREPIYMRVPPGHAKNWKKHCHSYGACGQRVYFVDDDWYETVYVKHHREKHGKKGHGDKGHKGHKDQKGKKDKD
jgi:hypothetical protein